MKLATLLISATRMAGVFGMICGVLGWLTTKEHAFASLGFMGFCVYVLGVVLASFDGDERGE